MKMEKIKENRRHGRLAAAAFALVMAAALAIPVMAAPLEKTVTVKPENGDDAFTVTFTADGQMTDNFTKDMFSTAGLQPGDSMAFKIRVVNEYGKETDWYMLNDVLDSLEGKNKAGGENANANTTGGAYEYSLTYQGPGDAAPSDIFASDTVGGVDMSGAKTDASREGLKGASDSLKDFFWFDSLAAGESGMVELRIKLEGESQGNNYQDTLADLQMRFAVEVPPEPAKEETTSSKAKPARTGDEMNARTYLIIGCAAVLLMALAAFGYIKFRKKAAYAEGNKDKDNGSDKESRS